MKKYRVVAAAVISSAFVAGMVEFPAYADKEASIQLLTSFTYQM